MNDDVDADARSRSGVSRPITQIASAKIPDRNGVENDEKKIATAATVITSNHDSTIALITADDMPTCSHARVITIAIVNTPTSTLRTSAIPRYLPITNSQRSIGLLTIAW